MEECTYSDPTWIEERRALRAGLSSAAFMPDPSREWDDRESHDPLTRDVAFNRHSMNDGHHISPTDNGMLQVGTDGIRVALAQPIDEEAFKRTLSMATRATIGLDMTQALPGEWEPCERMRIYWESQPDRFENGSHTDFWGGFKMCDREHTSHELVVDSDGGRTFVGMAPIEDWEEMLKGGLQTALETQVIVFAVSGASRTATHQLVRSRRAAFHQQSQRASYMGDTPECRMPESVWLKPKARAIFLKSVIASWRAYREICDEDISYQDARFVLPEGTTNFILLEYPVREFLNVYAYRGCSMFQWEIVHIMRECRRVLIEAHPWIEPYVKISCEKTAPALVPLGMGQSGNTQVQHHCTFQGWEDVEGQCSFSWAKHEARTFKPTFHRITRRPGMTDV